MRQRKRRRRRRRSRFREALPVDLRQLGDIHVRPGRQHTDDGWHGTRRRTSGRLHDDRGGLRWPHAERVHTDFDKRAVFHGRARERDSFSRVADREGGREAALPIPARYAWHLPHLEIRRHAERTDRGNEQSALTPAGRAMAESLAKRAPKFALVLSSPLPRARETAQLIAGRLDAVEAGLLPEMGGVIGDRIFGEMRTLADWADVLREREDARKFASDQLATWARIALRVGEKDRVLAISHGGIIELPAITLALRLRTPLDGPSFGYCEGVAITYTKGTPTTIAVIRV
ncbi:MAG: histidine phosphatase family protein [Chloroflexi bacterium]|nr:MAG: histidine phosphatase family protein [Chloroflexota bacterium]